MAIHDRGPLPLTPPQNGVWFAQQLDPTRLDYTIGEYLEIRGTVEPGLLAEAVRRTVAETGSLCVRFAEEDGVVRQVPAGPPPSRMDTVDVTGCPDPDGESERLMRAELARPMDLATGDIARHLLVRTGPRTYRWMQAYHHVVADGVTGSMLARRTAEVYSALAAGAPVPAADLAPWERIVAEEEEYARSGRLAEDREFWRAKLAGAPGPASFTGSEPARPSGTAVRVSGELDPADARTLREAARRYGTRWSALVMAAAAAHLHRAGGGDDVVLGLPVTGRTTADARRTRGMFSKVLPLRLTVTDGMPVGELVRRTSAGIKEALRHQRYRIEELRGGAGAEGGASGAAGAASGPGLWAASVNLMSFDYELSFAGAPASAHNLSVGPVEHVSLNVYDRGGDSPLTVQAEGDAADTGRDELDALRVRFTRFLVALAAADADATVGSLPFLTDGDRARLAVFGDGGAAPVPASDRLPLHALFERAAARTPDAVAVVCAGEEVSYRQLDSWAQDIADRLGPDVPPGTPVGVCVERSPAMVAALLGVLKAGGCYVPLDPALPRERIAYVVADAGLRTVVAQPGTRERLPGELPSVVHAGARSAGGPGGRGVRVPADSAAYLLYTSGSTGAPKGVAVPHAAAADFVRGHLALAGVAPAPAPGADGDADRSPERFLGFASLSFDVSVLDVFGALLSGSALVLATDAERVDVDRLQALLAGHAVSVADLPPALLPLLDPAALPALRFLSTGGEAPSGDAVDRWAVDGREVWNAYGPTEAAVSVTMHRVAPPSHGRIPPIGRPMANHRAYVVDRGLRLLPPGATGELCVAGEGLAHGYAGRAALTAGAFVPDPFSGVPGARMYRTGDLVRWSQGGELEFLGRVDRQVKINGHRIELGEIEAALGRQPSVGQAAVVVHEAPGGTRRLVAFVAPPSGGPAPEGGPLKDALALTLPRYMVPHTFVALDRLPLTASGKVDRARLDVPEPAVRADRPRRAYTAVETELAALFSEALGLTAAPDDNFFELGGDSITALGLTSRARAHGFSFTLRDVFAHKTAAALAAAVGGPRRGADAADTGPAVEDHGAFPATPVMRWLLDGPGPVGRFSQSMVLTLPEGADDGALVRVLRSVVDRHAALRLTVAAGPEGPLCTFGAPGSVDVSRLYGTAVVAAAGDPGHAADVDRAVRRAEAALDPSAGVVLRAVRLRTGDGPGLLLLCVHHLAVDGVSWRVLTADLAAAWDALAAGRPAPAAGVPVPFRAWAQHLEVQARSPEVLAELPFWQAVLDPGSDSDDTGGPDGAGRRGPAPAAPAPAASWDRVPDPVRDTAGTTRTLTLDLPAEVAGPLLARVPAALRTGPTEVLLAGLALAAHRVGASGPGAAPGSLLVDLEGHGRADRTGRYDLAGTVGWFTTQYPVRFDLRGLDLAAADGGGDALAGLVGRVHDALAAVPDHGTGFGLLSRLNPGTAAVLATLPRPRILFNYLGRFAGADGSPWSPAPTTGGLRAGADPAMPLEHCLQIDAMAVDGSDGPSLTAVVAWPQALLDDAEAAALVEAWGAALRLLAGWTGPARALRLTPRDLPLVRLAQPDVDALAVRYPGLADVLPLSPLQEGLFFHAAFDTGAMDAYTGQIVLTLDGAVDADRMRAACALLLRRHTALRSAFTDRGLDRPVQVVVADAAAPWEAVDLGGLRTGEREAAWRRLLAADRERRFDLERPPLVRFTLVGLGAGRHRLVMTNHHILWDGWSSAVLLRELLTGYAGLAGPEPAAPVAEGVPYRSHLDWLARRDHAAAEAAWSGALAGLAEPTLLGAADPNRIDALPERLSVELSAELTARLATRARTAGITLNSVVQGVWAVLLGRVTGRADVVFGGTVSGRTADVAGIEEMVGLLINTLPVRFRVREDEALLAALARFQDEQADLMDHQHTGLAAIQRAAGLGTLFDTTVVVENYPLDLESMRELAGGPRLTGVEGSDATHYTANLVVLPGERLRLHLDHRTDALDARTARSLGDALERLLTAVADAPDTAVGELDLLSADQHRLLGAWNDTAAAVPDTTLVELFEQQVARTPGAPATVFRGERLSYAELDARAERLARALRVRGAGPERIVAVALHRSTEMVVALLAVLKSGAAYLPVDPSLPAERIAYLLSDAEPVLLLATGDVADALPAAAGLPRLDPGALHEADGVDDGPVPAPRPLPSHPAYVIYTSGSTGRPKAVVVEHAAIVNRLLWMQDRYRLGADDRVLQKTPFGFDVSVWEFFWPLLAGAVLVVAEPGGHKDPAYLTRVIREEEVTTVHFVPSMLAAFAEDPDAGRCRSLRRVVCSGEALPEELKNRFLDVLDVPLHNLYGPTEAAVDVTHWDCRREDTGPVPIGRPIWNTSLYVLDPRGRRVPVGVAGELFLAGAGLARGYLRRPALTAERFPLDPFGPPGSRMYRTGDLARFRADGSVEYLGRTDDQVKIHGFRIELGEIETALGRLPGAGRAAVVVREDVPGERRLVGYVVPEPGAVPDPEAMRAELARSLPEYMVPVLVVVDGLPVTANGKLDRRALPAPAAAPGGASGYEPPAGETEELVAMVWAAVLDAPRIGRHDDFFALGGHSLSATRVAARLRQSLGLDLPLHTLFEQRTVAALAAAVETALLAELDAVSQEFVELPEPAAPPSSCASADAVPSLVLQGETS
ncbi:non-ribosomal peptide synthetase [Streptomyces subrutilus]|uniref:non-ribosomal peptide synthetase n=1 Tax=Streptomyces subrutilus TaxID=36818 RepID=UPI002E159F58|nr:non-ribosomal peptide synthetase [Streptomyces subrutilus]WSJ33288.1 amino acid adenylation domain-containing protein [Streptomyces subrutilus]